MIAVLVAILAWTAHASAQTEDLGELSLELAPHAETLDFVVVTRLEVPRPEPDAMPADALGPLARYDLAVRLERRAAIARSDDVETHAARARTARAGLIVVLEEDEASLDRAALLLLGSLRFDDAAERSLAARDAFDACTHAGRSDCPTVPPSIDDHEAVATWSRIDGDDAIASMALYERAFSLQQSGGDEVRLRRLLEATLATRERAPEVEANAAFLLGDAIAHDDPAAARAAFVRCAATEVVPLAAHCAIRAAGLDLDRGRPADALASLASRLDDAVVGSIAQSLAADALVILGADRRALRTIDPSVRARVLVLGAERLATLGAITTALALVEEARPLVPAESLDALAARIEARRSPETAVAWLVRAGTICALRSPPAATAVDVDVRFGAHAVVRATTSDPELASLAACLRRRAIAPETALHGRVHATLRLAPRARDDAPHAP